MPQLIVLAAVIATVGGGLFLGPHIAVWVRARRRLRWIRDRLPNELRESVALVLSWPGREPHSLFDPVDVVDDEAGRRALHHFYSVGGRGATIRVGPEAAMTTIEPIGVPFEARPLESLRELGAPPRGAGEGSRSWVWPIGLIGGLVVACLLLLWVIGSGLRRDAKLPLIVVGALIATFVPPAIQKARMRACRRSTPGPIPADSDWDWFGAPGGVILRRPMGDRWEVRVLTRSTHMLMAIARDDRGKSWEHVITDGDIYYRAGLPRDTSNALLRAWLSPLSPPPADELTDWTSNR